MAASGDVWLGGDGTGSMASAAAGMAGGASNDSIPWVNITGGRFPSAPVFNSHSPVLLHLLWASSIMSICGAGFIILSYALFPASRKFSRKLLVYLSIADICSASTWLWSTTIRTQLGTPSDSCVIQGFMLQFFYLASYVWTSCFAFHLFQLIWRKNTTEKYERYYHLLGWGVPLLIDLYFLARTLFGQPSMGNTERPWCWISSKTETTAWSLSGSLEQLVFFYLPLIVLFTYNMGIYAFLFNRVGRVLSPTMQNKVIKRLLSYLLVFVLCAIWGLINRIWQMSVASHQPPHAMEGLESFFSPLQGFMNALVYGLNDQLRARYVNLCCRRKPLLRTQETPALDTTASSRNSSDERHSEAPYQAI